MIEALDNFIDCLVGWLLRIGIMGLPVWFAYELITNYVGGE